MGGGGFVEFQIAGHADQRMYSNLARGKGPTPDGLHRCQDSVRPCPWRNGGIALQKLSAAYLGYGPVSERRKNVPL